MIAHLIKAWIERFWKLLGGARRVKQPVKAPRGRVASRGRGRSGRARRGAAAAELAILLPFLSLTFAAVLDFSRAYHVTQAIQASAHAGALYASGTATAAPDTSPEAAAKQAAVAEAASLEPAIDPAHVSVAFAGGAAEVTVSYDFTMLTPLLGRGGTVTITRSASMNIAPQ
jgi:Flp pilus assembly protein TadG